MPQVLIADRYPELGRATSLVLRRAGYQTCMAANHREAQDLLARRSPDLLLLDVRLPELGGFEICQRIRRGSDIPIMFFSSGPRPDERVAGLQAGGDDYIDRHTPDPELVARVAAVLRRTRWAMQIPTEPVQGGALMLDPQRQLGVRPDGSAVPLTPREVHLLSYLMKRAGRVCTTTQIVRHVWGQAGQQARSIVATSIWRLRNKLEADPQQPRHILTVRNLGYKFEG